MKKLVVIGASYLQLPLVLKAKEMGIETHCFAWDEGAVCKDMADFFYPISILNKEEILQVCMRIGIDGITSIASDAAVPTICYIAEKLGLVSNNYVDALVATDKYLMRKRFTEFNILSPKYLIAQNLLDLDGLNFPLIVKPTDRSGSRGVRKIESLDFLNEAIIRAKSESFSEQVIIEEFIDGFEVSVEAISWNGRHYILSITDKVTTGSPYFVELEHHQPSQLDIHIIETIKIETLKALTALNVNFGASHSEFKITTEGKVYVIEVGARMGGDFIGSTLVQLSTGYDFVKGVIEVALGEFHEPNLKELHCSGVYFLCKETERILPFIQQAAMFKEIKMAEITNPLLCHIQCSADRNGYLIYQSDKKLIL